MDCSKKNTVSDNIRTTGQTLPWTALHPETDTARDVQAPPGWSWIEKYHEVADMLKEIFLNHGVRPLR